jgi:hypothetical protein
VVVVRTSRTGATNSLNRAELAVDELVLLVCKHAYSPLPFGSGL